MTNRMNRLFLFLALALAPVLPAGAAEGDITITFMARPFAPRERSPGHAFFCITTALQSGPREECMGFYPVDATQALSGPGRVTNEFTRNNIQSVSISLTHRITEETRRNVYATIRRWTGANYELFVNNCGDFMFDVARTAGLQTPERSSVIFPVSFVEGLARLYWSGSWTTTDAQSRFSVRPHDALADWTERPQSGAPLTKTVPFSPEGGTVRIERANSADVLAFLGFQPALRAQILAAGPRPSYLIMNRIDGRATAQWFGLLAIKDEQANLRELRQPGSMPPREFEMNRTP